MRPYQARPKSKYSDPRWQKKRLEVMQRDGFECLHCGNNKATLNVHHCFYVAGRDPWEYENECLQTLCEECHSESRERRGKYNPEAGVPDGWWEREAAAAMGIILEQGIHDSLIIALYSELVQSDAVKSKDVPAALVCDVIGKAFRYTLSYDWLMKINAEAEVVRKAEEEAERKVDEEWLALRGKANL